MCAVYADANSIIKDGLEVDEIEDAVQDRFRYEVKWSSGSWLFIGITEIRDERKIIAAVLLHQGNQQWLVLEAELANEAQVKKRIEKEETTRKRGRE